MKYSGTMEGRARRWGQREGALPEASPTEEGHSFCPLCDLTFSLPWAGALKGPLRTLGSPFPTPAHHGRRFFLWKRAGRRCGRPRGRARASASGTHSGCVAPRVRTPRSPVPGLGLMIPPLQGMGEKRGARPCYLGTSPRPPPNPSRDTRGRVQTLPGSLRLRDQKQKNPGSRGAAESAERPKPGEGGEGCRLTSARCYRPRPVLGFRAGGRRVCPSGCPGNLATSGARGEPPPLRPGPGDPFPQHRDPRAPPAHFAKAKAAEPETKKLQHSSSPGLSARPEPPRALPRPQRQRARTGQEREAEWASLLPYAGQLEAGPPGPGTSRGSRTPPSAGTVPGPRHRTQVKSFPTSPAER